MRSDGGPAKVDRTEEQTMVDMQEPTTTIVASEPGRVTQAPSDVLRLAVAVILLVAALLVGAWFGDTVAGFAADLLRGLDRLPSWLVAGAAAVAQGAGLLLGVLVVGAAWRTRSLRLLLEVAVAALVAAAVSTWFGSLVDAEAALVTDLDPVGVLGEGSTLAAGALAALAAAVGTVSPWVTRSWRRAGWAVVVCVALVHFASNPLAFDTALALLVGWTVAAATTVIAGAPSLRPTGAAIAEGLAAVGVPLARLEQASLDARGSTPYFGETTSGAKLFVKALGDDERSADVMFRLYRRLQPRDLGDEKAFSTLRRAVEHEALVALTARDLGVRTPRVAAFATAEPSGFVLAYEAIAGRSLDRLAADEVTDGVLDAVWAQVAMLRSHRIAHRDFRLANVFLADDGAAWIIDFGFSELAASDLLLAADLAELIASSATVVGPQRAVAAAVRAVGPDATGTALDRMQLPMLSGATRTSLKADRATFDELRRLLASPSS